MTAINEIERELAIVKIKKMALQGLHWECGEFENSIFQKVLDMIEKHKDAT